MTATAGPTEQETIEQEPSELRGGGIPARLRAGISRNVFVLGLVSFFTDIASEMIAPLRALFLVMVLNTPVPVAGLVEGIAESTSSLLKIVSGRLADKVPRRKPLVVAGYAVSNLAKPLLAIVTTWQAALGIIFIDRVGKGIRTSPRDAMIADSTERPYMGKAFGFHRSLDTLGAAIGPLVALLILQATNEDLRAVFMWTAVPGVLGVLTALFFIRERARTRSPLLASEPGSAVAGAIGTADLVPVARLGVRFWMFTTAATLFALGNTSDAFIFLRTAGLHGSIAAVALAYFAYNVVYALLAAPLGALSDRWGRLPVLISGYVLFTIVYAGWALAAEPWNAWVLFLLYGVYTAATEGVSRAFVTDLVQKENRGTALGWYNGLTGLTALPANILGGWLWSQYGPSATFGFGAWASAAALALLLAWTPWLRRGFR